MYRDLIEAAAGAVWNRSYRRRGWTRGDLRRPGRRAGVAAVPDRAARRAPALQRRGRRAERGGGGRGARAHPARAGPRRPGRGGRGARGAARPAAARVAHGDRTVGGAVRGRLARAGRPAPRRLAAPGGRRLHRTRERSPGDRRSRDAGAGGSRGGAGVRPRARHPGPGAGAGRVAVGPGGGGAGLGARRRARGGRRGGGARGAARRGHPRSARRVAGAAVRRVVAARSGTAGPDARPAARPRPGRRAAHGVRAAPRRGRHGDGADAGHGRGGPPAPVLARGRPGGPSAGPGLGPGRVRGRVGPRARRPLGRAAGGAEEHRCDRPLRPPRLRGARRGSAPTRRPIWACRCSRGRAAGCRSRGG